MMLVILTAIIGFLSSTLPNILRYFEMKAKFRHELELATLKLEAAIRQVDADKEVEAAKEAVRDTMAARDDEDNIPRGHFIDIFRALIRPVVTVAFVALYLGFKIMTMMVLINNGLSLDNMEAASKIILDETTISIIMIVIGFYFGSRSNLNRTK